MCSHLVHVCHRLHGGIYPQLLLSEAGGQIVCLTGKPVLFAGNLVRLYQEGGTLLFY